MAKVIQFHEFMNGEYKAKEKARKEKRNKKIIKLGTAAILPLATCGTIGSLSFAMTALSMNIAIPVTAPVTVTVGAKEWMSAQTLSVLSHVLDPLVDIMVALSFPIASVIIVGSCFFFMFDKAEKAWSMIMKAGLGYVLIQVSPLILAVLKQVGNAV